MKKVIFTTTIAAIFAVSQAYAQEPQLPAFGPEQLYQPSPQEQIAAERQEQLRDQPPAPDYYPFYIRPSFPINWLPDGKYSDIQRYTIAVNPFYLISGGLKFDFEYELKTGKWIQTSLIGYYAPDRENENSYWWGDGYGNNRYSFVSGFDNYYSMWGVGASALYKHVWSRRGWYYSTGITLEYFNVKQMRSGYKPYQEEGLAGLYFYEASISPYAMSFVKPTATFNFGKHIAIAPVCFLDLYIGVGFSYSIYDQDKHFGHISDYDGEIYYEPEYDGMYGFARRGFVFNAGFRFGVLLWEKKK